MRRVSKIQPIIIIISILACIPLITVVYKHNKIDQPILMQICAHFPAWLVRGCWRMGWVFFFSPIIRCPRKPRQVTDETSKLVGFQLMWYLLSPSTPGCLWLGVSPENQKKSYFAVFRGLWVFLLWIKRITEGVEDIRRRREKKKKKEKTLA